jgi:hypothetical protein
VPANDRCHPDPTLVATTLAFLAYWLMMTFDQRRVARAGTAAALTGARILVGLLVGAAGDALLRRGLGALAALAREV